jgi:putative ATP-dependent endonuclease of the OLD family
MSRRPIIDEYDFFRARYQETGGLLPEIRIEVVLTDLSETARRRFHAHLLMWSVETAEVLSIDPDAGTDELPQGTDWCLPVVFIGRYVPEEDEFDGGTFFAHPTGATAGVEGQPPIGDGLFRFTREDKRHCGYLYLRANRTGNRALSFQRGSLIDTIIRLENEEGRALWEELIQDIGSLQVAKDGSGFSEIRNEVRDRVSRFMKLADLEYPIDLHASELTREHLREVLRLFIATEPGDYPVPFNRLSTGSLNIVVFALLTYIAELRGTEAAIFAMEEPEIALPPYSQRRLLDFLISEMGQVIVTSHSPYIIEKFGPSDIVLLTRTATGALTSNTVTLPADVREKRYRDNRRQFAEAILAKAVLVVEGQTEAVVLPAVADVLEHDSSIMYEHPDISGLSIFNAQSDAAVPVFAPVFRGLGKIVYGIHDEPSVPLTAEIVAKAADFERYTIIPYYGIEQLLVAEISPAVQLRFAESVKTRSDYPATFPSLPEAPSEDAIKAHVLDLLRARKGLSGYAQLLVGECSGYADLPATLADFLISISGDLMSSAVSGADSFVAIAGNDSNSEGNDGPG